MVFFISLQPVRDTRDKQIQLWKELILDYCKTQKIFVINLEEDFPLFSNPVIESKSYHLLHTPYFLSVIFSSTLSLLVITDHIVFYRVF